MRSSERRQMKICEPIDQATAVRAVNAYNRGKYRGRLNVDIDMDGYQRFSDGLSQHRANLIEQLRFIGEDYGGVHRRFLTHSICDEAALIAERIAPVLRGFTAAGSATAPLVERIPDEDALTFLFAPFVTTKRWSVWASKTLHFLRPESFPVLDSRAKRALGAASLGTSVRDYRRFCTFFRCAMIENASALHAARAVDDGMSNSDVKLLDKILYEVGADRTRCP